MRFATYLVAAISMVSTTLAAVTPATPVEKRFDAGPSHRTCPNYGFICPTNVFRNGINFSAATDVIGRTTCTYSRASPPLNNRVCVYDNATGERLLGLSYGTACPRTAPRGCQNEQNSGITFFGKRKLSKAEERLSRSQYNPKKRLAAANEE